MSDFSTPAVFPQTVSFTAGAGAASSTGAVQYKVLPVVSGTGVGSFNFAHHSFPNSFSETRDNDVYCFGYNVSEAGIALDTGDDSLTDIWETHYAQSASSRYFERHMAVRKKTPTGGTSEVRYFTAQIGKWNSDVPYFTSVACQVDGFSVTDKSTVNIPFVVNTVDATPGHGHVIMTGDVEMRGKTIDNILILNQQGSSGAVGQMTWQIGDANKWFFQARPTGQSFDFWILSNTLSVSPIVLQLGQADAKATFGGKIQTSASTTARSGMNFPSGTAPTSPTDGDLWFDGTNLKLRSGGATFTITKS